MWAFLLSKWGLRLAGVVAVIVLGAGLWIAGDIHGHRAEAVKTQAAIVRAHNAESANLSNQDTIASLKAANARWAAQAASSEARAKEAVSTLHQTKETLMSQLAASQAKLRSIENDHADVHAWSCQKIPIQVLELIVGADVARSVRSESGCEDTNRGSEGSSDSANPQGTYPAGAGAATAQQ